MKQSLSNEEKQVKLTKACKGGIFWSKCKLQRNALKQQQQFTVTATAISIDTILLEDSLPISVSSDVTSILNQPPIAETILTMKN